LLGVAVLLLGPWWVPATRELVPPVPRLSSDGPVVRNGVAVVVVCGKKRVSGQMDAAFFERMDAATKYAPESRTGTWGHEERGTCTVFYHHPPDATQREARQQRAQ